MLGIDIDKLCVKTGFISCWKRPSYCCRHPGLESKTEDTVDMGRPSAETKFCLSACSRSGGWSSPAGKPLSLVIVVDVGVEDCGVLEPELEFNWRRALAMSRWSCGGIAGL